MKGKMIMLWLNFKWNDHYSRNFTLVEKYRYFRQCHKLAIEVAIFQSFGIITSETKKQTIEELHMELFGNVNRIRKSINL